MKIKSLQTVSILIAVLPIIIGSLIFWTWYFFPNLHYLELWGVITILISIPVCLAVLIASIIVRARNRENLDILRNSTKTIWLTLLNIPLGVFYVWFAIYLMNTERITIVNNSENKIENVWVSHADTRKNIKQLEEGQSSTVWVYVTSEDPIVMTYVQLGQEQKVTIDGYPMGGHKYQYPIKMTNDFIKEKYGS